MLAAGLGLGAFAGPAALAHAAAGAEVPGSAGQTDEPPAWATFSDAQLTADLDGDGADEAIELRERCLVVRAGRAGGARDGDVLLETPEDWQVSDVLVADFDGDGMFELVFLLWRHGNFGSSRPFWLSAEADGAAGTASDELLTQHLFMYRWRADRPSSMPAGSDDGRSGRLYPVWMSSRLGVKAARIELAAAPDASTASALRRPRLRITSADGDVTLWEWLSWGFVLVEDEVPGDVGASGSAAAAGGLAASSAAADSVAAGSGDASGSLTLLVVGDNIAHANIYEGAYDPATRSFDFTPLYERVRGRVGACDLAAVCQETILVENSAQRSSYPLFATPQSMGDALADAGFNIVLGATNHANDQGPAAIDETAAFWAREHPEVTLLGLHAGPEAAGRPTYLERNGIRLALFDCTYGLNGRNLPANDAYRVDTLGGGADPSAPSGEACLLAGVAEAHCQADFIICFLHIGEEYDADPTAYQRDLAERLIDAGAGAIICSHAHVLGPYGRVRTEASNEGVVFYGLGNFVSGQCDDIRTILGGAAILCLERTATAAPGAPTASDATGSMTRVASCELAPLVCHTDGADGGVAAYFLDDYSDDLAATHMFGSLTGTPLTIAALRAHVPAELS